MWGLGGRGGGADVFVAGFLIDSAGAGFDHKYVQACTCSENGGKWPDCEGFNLLRVAESFSGVGSAGGELVVVESREGELCSSSGGVES